MRKTGLTKSIIVFTLILVISCGRVSNKDEIKSIIGKPVIIEQLEIAEKDFPKEMDWDDAKSSCLGLGDGWRLPTKDELYFLYRNRKKIAGFSDKGYWSSTEVDNTHAWSISWPYGSQGGEGTKNIALRVRAIRGEIDPSNFVAKTPEDVLGSPSYMDNLSIAEFDFPIEMSFAEATEACASLGEGWRLPTKEELIFIHYNKSRLNKFVGKVYWSSTEDGDGVFVQDFEFGYKMSASKNDFDGKNKASVHAVKGSRK
jgi:hypothetical protein